MENELEKVLEQKFFCPSRFAQEIEKIIPEVVVEVDTLNSEDTHKTVDYAKLTSVLIKAVQEQQQQINELKEKLNG